MTVQTYGTHNANAPYPSDYIEDDYGYATKVVYDEPKVDSKVMPKSSHNLTFQVRLMDYRTRQQILKAFQAKGYKLQVKLNACKFDLEAEVLRLAELEIGEAPEVELPAAPTEKLIEADEVYLNEVKDFRPNQVTLLTIWESCEEDTNANFAKGEACKLFRGYAEDEPKTKLSADAFNVMMGLPVDNQELAQDDLNAYVATQADLVAPEVPAFDADAYEAWETDCGNYDDEYVAAKEEDLNSLSMTDQVLTWSLAEYTFDDTAKDWLNKRGWVLAGETYLSLCCVLPKVDPSCSNGVCSLSEADLALLSDDFEDVPEVYPSCDVLETWYGGYCIIEPAMREQPTKTYFQPSYFSSQLKRLA